MSADFRVKEKPHVNCVSMVGAHTAGCVRAGEVRGEEEDGEAGKGRGGRRSKVESIESSEL